MWRSAAEQLKRQLLAHGPFNICCGSSALWLCTDVKETDIHSDLLSEKLSGMNSSGQR